MTGCARGYCAGAQRGLGGPRSGGSDFERAVSRFLSASLRTERIICLSSPYPEPVRPACARRPAAGRRAVPYLALHPMGFAVPRRLRFARCALTAPFHPYRRPTEAGRRRYVLCGTFRRKASPLFLPRVSPAKPELRGIAPSWCSDFPPSACAKSDSPPSQNRGHATRAESAWQDA